MSANNQKFVTHLEIEFCYLLYHYLRGYIEEREFFEIAEKACIRSGHSLYLSQLYSGYFIEIRPSKRPRICLYRKRGQRGGA